MRLKLITGAGVHGSLSMFVRSDGAAASKQSPLSDLAGDRCGVNSACRAILALVGGNESFVCGGGRRRSAHAPRVVECSHGAQMIKFIMSMKRNEK